MMPTVRPIARRVARRTCPSAAVALTRESATWMTSARANWAEDDREVPLETRTVEGRVHQHERRGDRGQQQAGAHPEERPGQELVAELDGRSDAELGRGIPRIPSSVIDLHLAATRPVRSVVRWSPCVPRPAPRRGRGPRAGRRADSEYGSTCPDRHQALAPQRDRAALRAAQDGPGELERRARAASRPGRRTRAASRRAPRVSRSSRARGRRPSPRTPASCRPRGGPRRRDSSRAPRRPRTARAGGAGSSSARPPSVGRE